MIALIATFFMFIGHDHPAKQPQYAVYVKTCKGEFARLFLDKKMTISMPNPLYPDSNGAYRFYTPSDCVEVSQ
jgi:hypothetical protein